MFFYIYDYLSTPCFAVIFVSQKPWKFRVTVTEILSSIIVLFNFTDLYQ